MLISRLRDITISCGKTSARLENRGPGVMNFNILLDFRNKRKQDSVGLQRILVVLLCSSVNPGHLAGRRDGHPSARNRLMILLADIHLPNCPIIPILRRGPDIKRLVRTIRSIQDYVFKWNIFRVTGRVTGWWFETPSCPLWRHRNVDCILWRPPCLLWYSHPVFVCDKRLYKHIIVSQSTP